jgi:hypothetical protein
LAVGAQWLSFLSGRGRIPLDRLGLNPDDSALKGNLRRGDIDLSERRHCGFQLRNHR